MKKLFYVVLFMTTMIPAVGFANSGLFPHFSPSKDQVVKYLNDPLLADIQQQFGATTDITRNAPLTRKEFLQIVLDSSQKKSEVLTTLPQNGLFSDVSVGDEIAKYIQFAVNNRIISGYADGTFKPNNSITRAEATKILVTSLGLKQAEKQTQFRDIPAENTLGTYIQTAYDNFLVGGTSSTTFDPNRTISKGELLKILYNIVNSGKEVSTFVPEAPKVEVLPIKSDINPTKVIYQTIGGVKYEYFHIPANSEYKVITNATNSPKALKTLVEQVGGVAGLNGAYFDSYSKVQASHTVRIVNGDRKTFSKHDADTGTDVIFGFDANGKPLLVQNMIWGNKKPAPNYNSDKINDLIYGIANFPLFLYGGRNTLIDYQKAWLVTAKMSAKADKTFICRTENNDIKMGRLRAIAMENVPAALQAIGCVDALNLDNGGSSAMYSNGRYVYGPGRNIMDAFVIVKK